MNTIQNSSTFLQSNHCNFYRTVVPNKRLRPCNAPSDGEVNGVAYCVEHIPYAMRLVTRRPKKK